MVTLWQIKVRQTYFRSFAMSDQNFEKTEVCSLSEVVELVQSNEFDKFNFHWLKSKIPEKCKREACIMGVDEAGRGPVLGPMVYSVFYCASSDIDILKEIGCTDSKALTEKKREDIFNLITENNDKVGWVVDIISPNKISNDMQKRVKCSLNEIAQNSTINLITSILENGVNLKEIFVDTIGPPDKYQEKLSKLFPSISVVVAKKADSLYPVVGAASICAKVIRDTIVEKWIFPESLNISDEDVGTGYPGDPKSKKFLTECKNDIFGFPNLVRFSWSTAGKLLENSTYIEWEDENDQNNIEATNIASYFNPVKADRKLKNICAFFKERSLKNVNKF